jgi:hypothetical protein
MSTTEVIKPYEGGPVAGAMPSAQEVIPVAGQAPIVLTPEAQHAAKAASEFAQAFPQFTELLTRPEKRGINNLDETSHQNLLELRRQMRATPPKPATVINLHPWPLMFDGNNVFLRGIVIPACNPGQPFSYAHIRGYRSDKKMNEEGTYSFSPILPIHMAAEFLRAFGNRDIYGGGIVIYEGDGNPEKVSDVELYDPSGRMLTTQQPGEAFDEGEQRIIRGMIDIPVRKNLFSVLQSQREARNRYYLTRVQRADHDYRLPDGRGKALVTELHRLMADVLFAEGVIAAVPEWDLKGRMEEGLADSNCKSCGSAPRAESFKCASCGHILNAYEAYMHGEIQYGHVSMDLLSADEWEMVEAEKERRETQRNTARARLKAKKAEAKKAAESHKPTEPNGDEETEGL